MKGELHEQFHLKVIAHLILSLMADSQHSTKLVFVLCH